MIAFANPDFATGDLSGWTVSTSHNGGLTGVTRLDLVEGYLTFASFAEISLLPGNFGPEQLEIAQSFAFPQSGLVVVSANIAAFAYEPQDQVSFATIMDGGTFGAGQVPFSPPPYVLRDRISSTTVVSAGNHSIGFRFYASVNAPLTNTSRRAAGYLGECELLFFPQT
jgi:hypothetical protein